MFSKLLNPSWVLYSNQELIELVEVREIYDDGVQFAVIIRYASGFEKEVFSGTRDDCIAFADNLLANGLGLRWKLQHVGDD